MLAQSETKKKLYHENMGTVKVKLNRHSPWLHELLSMDKFPARFLRTQLSVVIDIIRPSPVNKRKSIGYYRHVVSTKFPFKVHWLLIRCEFKKIKYTKKWETAWCSAMQVISSWFKSFYEKLCNSFLNICFLFQFNPESIQPGWDFLDLSTAVPLLLFRTWFKCPTC